MEVLKLMDIKHGWYSYKHYMRNEEWSMYHRAFPKSCRTPLKALTLYNGKAEKVLVMILSKDKQLKEELYMWSDKVYLGVVFKTKEEAEMYRDITDKILYL